MKKIMILGCAGSGKSTFAVELQKMTGLPLIHLDNIWWRPDRTHISRSEFDARLDRVMSMGAWILEGDYSRTYEKRMMECDTVFFLDYSEDVCMSGIRARVGKERPDIPWTESTLDPALVEEVRRYRNENRPAVMRLLSQYAEKELHIFGDRREAAMWLEGQTLRNADFRPGEADV